MCTKPLTLKQINHFTQELENQALQAGEEKEQQLQSEISQLKSDLDAKNSAIDDLNRKLADLQKQSEVCS